MLRDEMPMLDEFLITEDYNIMDTLKQLDKSARKILFVHENGTLLGVVTDGDIRRWIIKSGSLKAKVREAANYEPYFLYEKREEAADALMEEKGITAVPVVNSEKKILKIIFREQRKRKTRMPKLSIPVVIMAGGKGVRLKPYTNILPKPLIPVGEKTITEHIMERFTRFGCTGFIMIVNYKKHFIKSYFGDLENPVDVSFEEEEEYYGTGGGLSLLKGKMKGTFFVSNCDILIEEDYEEILRFHQKNKNLITMVGAVKNTKLPYGTIEMSKEGRVSGIREKPEFSFITNTGFYVLEPEFLERIPEHTFIHITDVIKKCIEEGDRVGAWPISEEHWLDMGRMEELEKMKTALGME